MCVQHIEEQNGSPLKIDTFVQKQNKKNLETFYLFFN